MHMRTSQAWWSRYKNYIFLSSECSWIFWDENWDAGFSTPALVATAALLTINDRPRAFHVRMEGCGCCTVRVVISSSISQNYGVWNNAYGLWERWGQTGSLAEVVWRSTETWWEGESCCIDGTGSGPSCKPEGLQTSRWERQGSRYVDGGTILCGALARNIGREKMKV